MKKIFILILLSVMVNTISFAKETSAVKETIEQVTDGIETIYADGKEATSTLYSDAKEVIKYMTPKVEAAVEAIGKSLKVGSEEVFTILCQQQIVKALKECIPLIIGIVLIIFTIIMSCKGKLFTIFNKGDDRYDDTASAKTVASFIGGFVCCVCIIISFYVVDFETMFTGFFNPKYGAIQDIINIATTFIN